MLGEVHKTFIGFINSHSSHFMAKMCVVLVYSIQHNWFSLLLLLSLQALPKYISIHNKKKFKVINFTITYTHTKTNMRVRVFFLRVYLCMLMCAMKKILVDFFTFKLFYHESKHTIRYLVIRKKMTICLVDKCVCMYIYICVYI